MGNLSQGTAQSKLAPAYPRIDHRPALSTMKCIPLNTFYFALPVILGRFCVLPRRVQKLTISVCVCKNQTLLKQLDYTSIKIFSLVFRSNTIFLLASIKHQVVLLINRSSLPSKEECFRLIRSKRL